LSLSRLAAFAVWITAAAAGAAEPSGELARVAALLRDGRSHTADFIQKFTPAGFHQSREESGTVTLQAPENVRFDYREPQKKVFAFDGKTAAFFAPAEKQMTVRHLTPEDRGELPLIFLEAPEELGRNYTIQARSEGPVTVVDLVPRRADADVVRVRLKISAGLPLALEFETAGGDRTAFEFRDFRAGPPRPAAEFALRPPAGTRVVPAD
jgi:outer membrane lipoprotein-sorting protein